jgi:hypothetical protein
MKADLIKYTLCRCNNCNSVMYEPNASSKAWPFTEEEIVMLEKVGHEVRELEYFKGLAPGEVEDNEKVFEDTGFYGCPVCKDDGYLFDIERPSDLPEPKIISLQTILHHAAGLTDGGRDKNLEYVRGILELIAFCDMRGMQDTDVRIEQIRVDLGNIQPAIQSPG